MRFFDENGEELFMCVISFDFDSTINIAYYNRGRKVTKEEIDAAKEEWYAIQRTRNLSYNESKYEFDKICKLKSISWNEISDPDLLDEETRLCFEKMEEDRERAFEYNCFKIEDFLIEKFNLHRIEN